MNQQIFSWIKGGFQILINTHATDNSLLVALTSKIKRYFVPRDVETQPCIHIINRIL